MVIKRIGEQNTKMWYPENQTELNELLEKLIIHSTKHNKKLHGLIVPHAGYEFSGEIAGKAYSLLNGKKIDKIAILAPSHYVGFSGVVSCNSLSTPLGNVRILKNDFPKSDSILRKEHSLDVQLPFIQKLLPQAKILPLVVGELTNIQAEELAKKLSTQDLFFIISSDLSHFNKYEKAKELDMDTIELIEDLDLENFNQIDACGKFPLLVLFYLCKLKGWKPKLLEYKNSGDVTGNMSSVVGYASFMF